MKTKEQLEKELMDFLQKKQFLTSELNKLDGIILYIQNELSLDPSKESKNAPL